MPTYFFKECGSSTQSTSNIPKFCSSCGESFSSELPIKPPVPKPIKARLIEKKPRQIPEIVLSEEDFEYDTDIQTELTMPDRSSVEIVGDVQKGIKFENILNQKPQGTARASVKIKGKKAKDELKKKMIDEYKKEGKEQDKNSIQILGEPGD